ncbi:P-loop containing nucleoside triphosphate hydrolase protein, partial [Clavulina sp. PMI_390]
MFSEDGGSYAEKVLRLHKKIIEVHGENFACDQNVDWIRTILGPHGLGHETPQGWQAACTRILVDGTDVFLTAGTGSGKSAIVHAFTLARAIQGKPSIALIIQPTRALMDDQVQKAQNRGLRALAIHQESLGQATTANRNLWNEAEDGKWELLFLSPEMITTSRFRKLLEKEHFLRRVGMCVIDEAHLVGAWREFRDAYKHITTLRPRLPTRIAFLAMTATLENKTGRFQAQQELGFTPGRFHDERQRIDRPNIIYKTRIIQHSTKDFEFPDLEYLVANLSNPKQIPRTMIAVDTIQKATRVIRWL